MKSYFIQKPVPVLALGAALLISPLSLRAQSPEALHELSNKAD